MPIYVPAKFVYGIRSIHFYRQFRLFFSKRLLWCIVARIWYGRVCQLLAVGRCFTPTTPPLKQTIIYIAIVCQKWCLTTNQSINLPDALIEKCVGQNLFMCNLVRLFSWKIHNHAILFQKTNPHENKMICPLKTWSWNYDRETSYTMTISAYLMWYSLSVTRRRTIFYFGHSGFLH